MKSENHSDETKPKSVKSENSGQSNHLVNKPNEESSGISVSDYIIMKTYTNLKTFNVMLLGDNATGKTALLNKIRYEESSDKRSSKLEPTRFTYFKRKVFSFGKSAIQLKLWDSVSGIDNISKNEPFFKYIDLILLCLSPDKVSSLESLSRWNSIFDEYFNSNVLVYVVLTKSDIPKWSFSIEDLELVLIQNKLTELFDVSCETNRGINELVLRILQDLEELDNMDKSNNEGRFTLGQGLTSRSSQDRNNSSSNCC